MNVQAATKYQSIKPVPFRRWLRIATAVGAAVLLLFLVVKVYQVYQLSVEKIYDQSYVPYNIATTAVADTASFTTIELYYAEGNYNEVVRQSKNLLSVTDRERLLIGIAYLYKEEYLPAISWLKRLAEVENTPCQQVAEYYLTLTHLKNKDYDRTIDLMQKIVSSKGHPYQSRFTTKMINDVELLKWL